MNTFWLKIAGAVVGVVILIIAVKSFTSSESKPKPPPKTIYDMWEQDDKRLTTDPVLKESPNEPNVPDGPGTTVATANKGPENAVTTKPPKLEFRELSQIEKIEAERLFNVAITHRKMGRLQGIGLNTMVKACRQIIERFPGSEYEFKAKRMLGDIPERFRSRFKITEEEIDLGDWK
jgi:type IV secretory pathway VirB10-like protein